MENTHKNNSFDIGVIFKEAMGMLEKGIARVCYYPVAALDKDGQPVSLTHPNAYLLTPSGAIIEATKNHLKDGENIEDKTSYCLNEIAKQFPRGAFILNYDIGVSIDLACLKMSDKEILSAFDVITSRSAVSYV